MVDIVLIAVLIGVFLATVGLISYLVIRRYTKSRVLIIEKDFRNPNAPPKKFYAIYDYKEKYIALYKNIFQPGKTTIIPPFQLESYVHGGKVFAYQGVTGQPEDDNIVPVHYPLVSDASAKEFSSEISGAFLKNIELMNYARAYAVGDDVEYVPEGSGIEAIPGQVTNMTYSRISVTFAIPQPKNLNVGRAEYVLSDDNKNPLMLGIILPYTKELETKLLRPNKKDYQQYDLADYANVFFGWPWVMQTFGIVPVDDVNVVLKNNKDAVSSFNSKVADWKNNKQSWLAKNQVLIGFLLLGTGLGMMLLLGYSGLANYMSVVSSSATTANHAITNASIAAINHIAQIASGQQVIISNSTPI